MLIITKVRINQLTLIPFPNLLKMFSPPYSSFSLSFTDILHTTNIARHQIDHIQRVTVQIYIRQNHMPTIIHRAFTIIRRENHSILSTFNFTTDIATFTKRKIGPDIIRQRKIATKMGWDASIARAGPTTSASTELGATGFKSASCKRHGNSVICTCHGVIER